MPAHSMVVEDEHHSSSPKSMYFAPSVWSRRFGNVFFTAVINGFEIQSKSEPLFCCVPDKFAVFVIQVKRGDEVSTVRRRARDFYALHNKIQFMYSANAPHPTPPPKTLGVDISPSFLNARMGKLASMLDEILNQFNLHNDGSSIRKDIAAFLELEGH
jgi:hypothetical protein